MVKQKPSKEAIEELVLKAQEGDTEAFAQVYDAFVDPIYRYISFKVKRDDALDLTETVFLKVWENIRNYQHGQNFFSSWIFRIAHNVVVDHYRLSKDFLELQDNIPDEKKDVSPVYQTEKRMGHEMLRKAIGKLKKSYQQIIVLKYLNELENEEIAQILKKSEGSLRILKFRALKALKQVLEEMNIRY
ncbi:sigma-70 family RNA polymerase sigma factor [Candidatus Peregrinibacteria bacterium]|nr:sigma-70 family RNA polymerase sigma factor [Candidatus Peregrinibacteria bacterium]